MTRCRLTTLLRALAAASAMVAAGSIVALGENAAPPAAADGTQAQDVAQKDDQSSKTIEKIIEESESVLSGRGFTYDPAGRRDPFRSLVEQTKSDKGPRPKGIAGMLISEVDLVGIVQKGKDNLAFFNGSDNKGYFLRVGDQLYDGRIIQINRQTGQVVFRQEINDPRSIKPYRDITKRLYSAEEEKL
ncbi:MAG: pilus assembly protein PilP [Acidobacteria bacterium]|nr:pilus assembly protein PilP [Acidobacteriota bacterium]